MEPKIYAIKTPFDGLLVWTCNTNNPDLRKLTYTNITGIKWDDIKEKCYTVVEVKICEAKNA